jgi:hypothetical protein
MVAFASLLNSGTLELKEVWYHILKGLGLLLLKGKCAMKLSAFRLMGFFLAYDAIGEHN